MNSNMNRSINGNGPDERGHHTMYPTVSLPARAVGLEPQCKFGAGVQPTTTTTATTIMTSGRR